MLVFIFNHCRAVTVKMTAEIGSPRYLVWRKYGSDKDGNFQQTVTEYCNCSNYKHCNGSPSAPTDIVTFIPLFSINSRPVVEVRAERQVVAAQRTRFRY